MTKWTEPVTDRDAADITARNSKAFFNVADWIRINGNAEHVNALVNILRVLDIEFEELAEPVITTIPDASDINSFVANIERLRLASPFPVSFGITELKDDYVGGLIEVLDYNTLNSWESDLEKIKDCLLTAANWTVYCGVASVGQARFWQVQWRRGNFVWPVDDYVRRALAGVGTTGSGLTRQNSFRRYIA